MNITGRRSFFTFLCTLLIILCALLIGCDVLFSDLASKDGNGDRSESVRTVTFRLNDGSGDSHSVRLQPGETTVTNWPLTPGRSGYVFTGWNTQANGSGTAFTTGTQVTSNITVHAQWTAISGDSRTVTFNPGADGYVFHRVVTNNQAVDKPADPIRPGYTFGAWQMNGAAWNFSSPVTNDITLVASWTPITYTVTYHANGGVLSSGASSAPQTLTFDNFDGIDQTLRPFNHFTREGWLFTHWSTKSGNDGDIYAAGQKANLATMQGANVDLYAQWMRVQTGAGGTPENYTVIYFDSMGGGTVSPNPQIFYESGKKPIRPTDPEKDDHNFINWFNGTSATAAVFNFDAEIEIPTSSVLTITVYAHWESTAPDPISYSVTYHRNGGGGTNQTVTRQGIGLSTEYILEHGTRSSLGFTAPENRMFGGWKKDLDDTVAKFFAGQGVRGVGDGTNFGLIAGLAGQNVDLYAHWVDDTSVSAGHIVTFNLNYGANAVHDTKTVTSPETTIDALPTQPGRSGYVFAGWNTEADGTGTEFTTSTPVTGSIPVYAQWQDPIVGNG